MFDEDGRGYGHTPGETRKSDLAHAVREIERSRGIVPNPRKRRTPEANANGLHASFARAEREQRELQRLKAIGKPWACLDYHPERLGRSDYEDERLDS